MHRRSPRHRAQRMSVALSCVLAGIIAAQPVIAASEPLATKSAVEREDIDRYVSFDGVRQWGQAISSAFDIVNDISVSAWVRPDTVTCANECAVLNKHQGYAIYIHNSVFWYQFHDVSTWTKVSTGITARAGEWVHVALTRVKSTGAATFYINGVAVKTSTYTSALGTNTDSFALGAWVENSTLTTASLPYDGDIDEVRLWNVVRTETEIRNEMHTWGPTGTTGLVGYWDFNESSNSSARNLASGSSAAPASASMTLINRPTKTDVKQVTTTGNDTVVTFPRSYLTSAGGWTVPSGVSTARTLVIGGGGGGGPGRDASGWHGGGGGAGGYLASTSTSLEPGSTVPVTVGLGGIAGIASNVASGGQLRQQTSGQNSVLSSLIAVGGGAGGSFSGNGATGGSGGGGGMYTGTGGTATSGQGYGGGNAAGSSNFAAGGGGGSAGAGSNATGTGRNATGGAGGAGTQNDINGTLTRYAAGGNGAGCLADASTTSGGQTAVATNGTRNTGSGGGAGGDACNSRAFRVAGDGGSGVVIVRYASANQTCLAEQTTQGAHTVVAFKDTGTCSWTIPSGVTSIDYLVVAGGGGGASRAGGGGGAGGYLTATNSNVTSVSALSISVGAGGVGAAIGQRVGTAGSSSSITGTGFTTVTANGGGYGGNALTAGGNGGSGGGAGGATSLVGGSNSIGSGSSGQGFNGGSGRNGNCAGSTANWCAGGGGGAGAAGGNGALSGAAGSGGAGLAPAWLMTTSAQRLGVGEVSGSSVFFAGGGGGGADHGGTAGAGGVGGGGAGSISSDAPGADARSNTGGGGGGSGYHNTNGDAGGGNGGSGVVIIRFTTASVTSQSTVDSAAVLNGTNQYYEVAEGTQFVARANYTVESWIYPTSTTCSVRCPFMSHDGDYIVSIASGKFVAHVFHTSTGQMNTWNTKAYAVANEWQHVAFVRDGASIALYVNGDLMDSSTLGGAGASTYTNAYSLWIGKHYNDYFAGRVDQWRLWSTVRSQSQIQTAMHEHTPSSSTGLVAQYDFNGVTGTSVANSAPSAAANTALTAYNSPTYVDIKTVSSTGMDALLTFPRSYLTAGGGWTVPGNTSALSVLAVGGGGGGGTDAGGGGGGGGMRFENNAVATSGASVTVKVGQGGRGGSWGAGWQPTAGQSSVVAWGARSYTAGGGNGGDNWRGANGSIPAAVPQGGTGGTTSGNGSGSTGGAGGNGPLSTCAADARGVAGNNGSTSSVTGASTTYGGGGGGGVIVNWDSTSTASATGPAGGSGGGGRGSDWDLATRKATTGFNGTDGLGGGGGGSHACGPDSNHDRFTGHRTDGGLGGTGVVVIRYSTTHVCTPVTSRTGVYVVTKFTALGDCTWTVPTGVTSLDYLVVAGGGGGGAYQGVAAGGGGGAGGVLDGTALAVTPAQQVTVNVGGGGAGGISTADSDNGSGTAGSNSQLSGTGFTTITASGGGFGSGNGTTYVGGSGGSGGGALGSQATAATGGTGNAGPPRQGYNGGSNDTTCGTARPGGGGGGASSVGGSAICTGVQSGSGGTGRAVSITGSSIVYGGGGGGGASGLGAVAGGGGIGGGGNGGGIRGVDGVDGLGGGGGGAGYDTTVGVRMEAGSGGDGVIVLRYVDRIASVNAGNNQTVAPSTQLPTNPKIIVRDAAGNTLDGIPVIFEVTAGGGTIGTSTVTTSGGGFAATTWTIGASGTQTMTATLGLAGSNTVTFTANVSAVKCDVGFDELNFDFASKTVISAVNSSKPGFNETDKVLFQSIATKDCDGTPTVIDALVTTSDLVGATITAYEANAKAGGANSYFQADADITAANGYAEFTFQFYENGTYGSTNRRVFLQNVKITAIDIDYYQYNYVTGIDSFTVASNTRLTTTRTPSSTFPTDAKFQGSSSIGDNDPRDQVVMGFGEVLEFSIRFGRSAASSPNYYGVAFKELGWGTSTAVSTGEQFDLTYDINGGTGGSAPGTQTASVASNVTTASNSGSMTRTGYTFAGWNTAANGSGTTYLSGSSFTMPQGGDTLYAQWTPTNYSLIYNANGGANAPSTQTVAYNATATVAGAGSMTRTGYTFAGWNTVADGSGTARAAANTFSMPASNVTLYAQWTINQYTVTYDANGGATPPSATTANAGSTVTVSGVSSMTRTGYTFTGWNTVAGGTGTSRTAASTFTLNADVTLYAQWSVNTYTVTYNANGGTNGPASSTKTYNSTVTVSGAGSMTRTGYTFTGWNTMSNGSGTARAAAATFSMPDSNVTLYAQWTPNQHDVLYVANDTSLGATAANIPAGQLNNNFGSTVSLSGASPTLAGYTFNGWNTAANGSGTAYLAGASLVQPDADVTLYAQWVPDIYDLIYNANGGTGAPSPGQYGTNSQATVSLTEPTRTGYDFSGWHTTASGTGGTDYNAGDTFTMPANDITLYAKWTVKSFSVIYNGNGGGGSIPSSESKQYASTVTVAAGTPTRNGYTFTGWNTAANGSGTAYTGGNTFSMPVANVTLYAQWAPNQYTVTYDANSGTQPPNSQTAATDSSVTVAGAGSMTRTGYSFTGWNTVADGSGTSRSAASTFTMPAANVTLYAQWSATVQIISYNANGGNGAPGSATSPTDATATVSGTSPTRSGYTFTGWNTAANGSGTDYVGGNTFTMPSTNVTLYAKWTPLSYIVSYNANGGSGAPSQHSEFTDATVTVSSTAPTRTGYSLVAWNTAVNGSGTVRAVGGSFTMPAANVILYAQWIANANQVMYNATGGTGAPGNASAITDSTVTVSSTVPTRNGYVFAGWNTAADGSGTSYSATDTFTMPGTSVTLYAQWTTRNYTITYNANQGSSAPSSQIEAYLSLATLSSTLPVYTGYIFMGWTTDQPGATNAYLNGAQFLMPSNDVTLYAQWQADINDVYFFANGGTGGTSTGIASTGSTVTLGTMVTSRPTRTGYTFAGWNTAAAGTGTNYTWNSGSSTYSAASFTMPGTDVFLYAQWTPINYTVTYNANNGTGTLPAVVTANYQDSVFVSYAPGLTRNGFTFVGWNTDDNRGGTDYAPSQNLLMPAANVTLYAIWQANVNAIVYNPAGGNNAPASQFAATSQSQTLSSQIPERIGHSFVRWVDSSGTPRDPGDSLVMPASSTMLFAVWSLNSYTLTYNANGGSGAPAASTLEYGATVTVSSTLPTRVGFTFAGWNISSSGSGTAYASASSFSMPAENMTLFAQWNAVPTVQTPASPSTAEKISSPAVTAPATAKKAPELVRTGISTMSSVWQALVLVLAGATLMFVSRRRRHSL